MKNPLIVGLVLTGLLASPVAVEAVAVPGAAEAPSLSPAVSEATVFQTKAWQKSGLLGKPDKKPAYICDDSAPPGLDDTGTTDLIAGQHNVVGKVTFALDGETLRVTYQTDSSDLVITEAHLYVGDGPPTKSAPGQFPYHWPGNSGDSPSSTVVFEVDYPGGCQTIAAHSVVEDRSVLISYTGIGLDELPGELPTTVDMCVKFPGVTYPDDSYFDARILNSFDPLLADGIYDAYCVNTGYSIGLSQFLEPNCDVEHTAKVWSSYDVLPAGLIPEPDNLDMVNWLINQDLVGETSLIAGGVYTWGDLQRAIWDLVSPVPDCAGCNLGSWTEERAAELLDMAVTHGSGFEPTCGERVAIILDPVNADEVRQQPIIVWIELPCIPEYGDETAWAGPFSCQFTTGWGWFFEFCESEPEPPSQDN